MLDLRKLLLLRELHARGTVAAVAEALSFTPSAVSQQLAQLQREAGVALTEKVGRRLQLTDAGLRLVEHADALLARVEEAEAELQSAAGAVFGRLKVASLQTPMLALVAPAIRDVADAHPQVRVEVLEMEPERALPALALGTLDLVVAEEYHDEPRRVHAELVREELCDDRIIVALGADHPLARSGDPIRLRDLAEDPWVSPHPETQFARMQARTCRVVGGFEPDVRHWANDLAVLLALIAQDQGVGLLPMLGNTNRVEGVATRALADVTLERTIYAYTRRSVQARPAVRAMIEALRGVAVARGLR
jgi:DNA-binding transcriptional LysR family regulator